MKIYLTKKMTKKMYAFTCFFVLLLPIAAVFAKAYENRQVTRNPSKDSSKTVIIDPGHGDPDGGAVGVDGVIEKNINLSLSCKLRDFFLTIGYTVIMTREDDSEIYDKESNTIRKKKVSDLRNRLEIINSHPGAIFISIHQNISKSPKSSGSMVIFSPNNDLSNKLAQSIQNSITKMLQPENKRAVRPSARTVYLLKNAKSPAVLVECGFLSNPADCKLLEDDSYQSKMAFSIFCGVLEFKSSA